MKNEFLYETHMHTAESSACGHGSAAQHVESYIAKGYTGIIVTDHFINGNSSCPRHLPWEAKMHHVVAGYIAAKKAGDKAGLDVFLGWEFSYHGADFLTYGLGLDFLLANPDVDRLTPPKYSELVRKSGGYIAQAHPFRVASYIRGKAVAAPEILDGMEIRNASDNADTNKRAREYAEQHNIPIQAGSDSHGVTNNLSGIALKTRASSIHDIIAAIKAREVEII